MIQCGKEKCSNSKNSTGPVHSCMKKHCSKTIKNVNNTFRKTKNKNNKKRAGNIKKVQKCAKKHCSKNKNKLLKN